MHLKCSKHVKYNEFHIILQSEKYGLSFVKLHSPAEVSTDEPMDTDTVICLFVCVAYTRPIGTRGYDTT